MMWMCGVGVQSSSVSTSLYVVGISILLALSAVVAIGVIR